MTRLRTTLVITIALAIVLVAPAAFAATEGEAAYSYMQQLSTMSRIAGAASELGSAGMIEDWFEAAGYSADLQPFTLHERRQDGLLAERGGHVAGERGRGSEAARHRGRPLRLGGGR